MNSGNTSWQRLLRAARAAPAEDGSAPFGFSTRVAALAFEHSEAAPSIFGRMALRAAGVSCLLALAAVAANYSAIQGAFEGETSVTAPDDPIDEVVNLGS